MKNTILIISGLFLLFTQISLAQSNKLTHKEDKLMGKRVDGEMLNILVGNVKFTQPKTIIHCDSAIFYNKKNSLEAFGHVRIIDLVDSVVITSKTLTYDGNTRKAHFREKVVYTSDSVILKTDFLDYDMINRSANYFNGGNVNDGTNKLKSVKGFYDTQAQVVTFEGTVHATNPNYILEAENLIYNIVTKIATINSPNTITHENGSVLHAEIGSEFNMQRNTRQFLDTEIESESYILEGEDIFWDAILSIYTATGNVKLTYKEEEVIITGDKAVSYELLDVTYVFGNAVMKKHVKQDTMYLSADTLIFIDDTVAARKRLLAYPDVRMYKKGLQGRSDSLAYHVADSIIHFYQDPIMWNQQTQITADSIDVTIRGNLIDKMYTKYKSFIIAVDSVGNYNQIKGRKMTAHFVDNLLSSIDVNGNGESIYFAWDDDAQVTMGMNSILCSDMKIRLVNNEVDNITFLTSPEGKFIPPFELKEDETRLRGFEWRDSERPEIWEVLRLERHDYYKKYFNLDVEPIEVQETVNSEAVEILKKKRELKSPVLKQENQ